jgi:phosphoglycerate transport regulatory protein PgtC
LFVPTTALADTRHPQEQKRENIAVVTSFAGSTTDSLKYAFEAAEPSYRLQIIQRKTSAALSYVMAPDRPAADIFWASAPDAFELLAALDRFESVKRTQPLAQPRIGIFPIDDPSGRYLGFALSGYGISYEPKRLSTIGVSAPVAIEDLRRPEYRGQIGMTAPSRSGTAHLMVESILQRQGWDAGWALWLEIAGNLSGLSARSFSVRRGLQQGRFSIALSIDFLAGQSNEVVSGASEIVFVEPDDGLLLPASIGLLRNAANPEGARRFISFLLSQEGQLLIASPAVNRLPSDISIYELAHAKHVRNPFQRAATRRSFSTPFSVSLSAIRYDLVNLLFDELITYPLNSLQRALQLLSTVERLLTPETSPVILKEAADIRSLLMRIPVNSANAIDPIFTQGFQRLDRGVPVPLPQAAQVNFWRKDAADRYARATTDALRLLARLGAVTPLELRP